MLQTVKFGYKKESKQNPYIGFTSFQHFRNDELYSDLVVKPENNMTETEHVECYPVPAYVEEKGRAQGYYPDCSVVYIRILWKEFEPKQGEFNYPFIDSILEKAKANGQTVMFRLMQHSTRESDDVPDWVKEQIECPARPQGMRVKDCPSDPKFLELFADAVRALGRYDSDPTLALMDLSLPGAWGEGSHYELFTQDQLKKYVDAYVETFPNTLLIAQTNPPWLNAYIMEKRALGWRADCIGRPNLTYELLPPRVEKMGDAWKTGHVSFEAYWWLGEWQRQGWELQKIIDTLLSWHISTFNAKSLPIPFAWKEQIDEWVAKMGYHFTINEATLPKEAALGKELTLSLTVENVGVAPIYNKLPLKIRLKNTEKEVTVETKVDICQWIEGEYTEEISIPVPADLREGEYEVQIGIGGGETPSVVFATDAKQDGDFSVLAKIAVMLN